jgi:hypothetical protein
MVKVRITQIYPVHSITSFCQSILSQFSQKTKVTEDMTEEAEDAATFHELEDELGEDETTEDVDEEMLEMRLILLWQRAMLPLLMQSRQRLVKNLIYLH